MSSDDPVDLLFGGMGKLGPGSDVDTVHVLRLLPRREFRVIVDAGCGTGRQTLALAAELDTTVHAIDRHRPFLEDLARRARQAQIWQLVQTHLMDMRDIPQVFDRIDLLWSQGAAYNIGFAHALAGWLPALAPRGVVVISELSWLRERVPAAVSEFFRSAYPDMRSVPQNHTLARSAGYRVLAAHTLASQAWVDGYYDILEPRALALLDHPAAPVRELARATVEEIEVFHRSDNSYGYVFYVFQRA